MPRARFLGVLALGLFAAACSSTVTTYEDAPTRTQYVMAPVVTPVVVAAPNYNCLDYGFTVGTAAYDRCAAREAEMRASRAIAYSTGYDHRVATTGIAVYTDEYGFRYDAQGNRVDRFGNIISPHSTQRY
jgi:hypothetical protein